MTVQLERRQRRRHAQHLHAAFVRVFQRRGARVASAVDEPDERLFLEIVAARDARLVVGVAVGDQLAVRRDDERISLIADTDAVDHPPHFLEADFADE